MKRLLNDDRPFVFDHGVFLIPTLHDTDSIPINCSGLGFTKTGTWRFKLLNGILYQTPNIQGVAQSAGVVQDVRISGGKTITGPARKAAQAG